MFRNIGRMQERHRTRLPIDHPGILKVFVYEPRRPPKGCHGQLFLTGVIRATGDTIVTALLPSQRDLPPISTTPSPITDSACSHPYDRQHLTNNEYKKVMEVAKSNMRRKILLENAMPEAGTNAAMAEAALLAASQEFMSGVPINQLPQHKTCLKTLHTLTTTIWATFKMKARCKVPTHYDLNRPSDANAEVTHRLQCVLQLVENHAYLFVDETNSVHSLTPINHPAVSSVIVAALWESSLHKEIDLDDVNALDNLFLLGGAAMHSVLMEYLSGRHKTVDVSISLLSWAEYCHIQQHDLAVQNLPEAHNAFISSKNNLVE
ncbi:hypothetical protein BDR03DRAFT_1017200 [Suillus americanus]|nr:hypothetical protein BDR03DRAFT_1017200 [Suillus americanus]